MTEEKIEEKIEVIKKPYSKEKIGVTVMLVGLTAAIFLAIGYWAGTQSTSLTEETVDSSTCPTTITTTPTPITSVTASTTDETK